MHQIREDISSIKSPKDNVNNVTRCNDYVKNDNKDIDHVNNVSKEDLTKEDLLTLLRKKFSDDADKQRWLAETLASKLSDIKNLNYYRKLAKKYPDSLLFECLSITEDAIRDGVVQKTAAKYFVGVVKRKTARKCEKST